ncbi:ATP-binding protein [Deltaproteobacteria bacterium TL4]
MNSTVEMSEEESINARLLAQGFEAFNEATLKLREYYRGLEGKVDELNHELARKNNELELNLLEKERVKNYLSNIFESSAIGIIVTDLDGMITSVNQTGLKMTGCLLEKLYGKSLNHVFQAQVLPEELTLQRLKDYENIEEQELDFQRTDGNLLKLRLSISLMYSENGDILGLIINMQDITELRRLEADAERKNRFTVMGEMAASIAHEVRNPLGSIELFSSLLKKELDADSPQQVLIEHISSAIKSMNHIISNLLEFTKPRPISGELIDLHVFLHDILEFSHYLVEHNQIELKTNFAASSTQVRGETELLKQVFHNLIMNAIQAMLEPGELLLTTRSYKTNNKKLLDRFQNLPGHRRKSLHLVEVSIRDSGIGMSPEVQKKIFDPFFSTKERGTGLGLAIVHNIIESHRAIIDIESKVNQGTCVTITFPLHEKTKNAS